MRVDRRSLLKSGAVAGGIIGAPVAARAFAPPALMIFDSRNLQSRAFVHGRLAPSIDVAQEDAQMWRALRTLGKARVDGLTGWSDWVLVRGLLEERGLRVRHEERAGRLFRWTMA